MNNLMKVSGGVKKSVNYSIPVVGVFFALISLEGYAGGMAPAMEPVAVAPSGKIYGGVFGGAGGSTKANISQYGTAFFPEANGGPLAVNSFGRSNSRTVGIVGGNIGYQWAEILSNSQWGLVPAIELEGYYLGRSSFKGHEISNFTNRLPEHDFLVTYPTKAGVFLANAILKFNCPNQSKFHPYLGVGIGSAVFSVSNATSTQVAPAEPGVNHYNSNPNDSSAAFAVQGKVGLSFELTSNLNIFAEYRPLYVSKTHYTFGSTNYPNHAATSSWLGRIGSHYYNMGAVGLQYSI